VGLRPAVGGHGGRVGVEVWRNVPLYTYVYICMLSIVFTC